MIRIGSTVRLISGGPAMTAIENQNNEISTIRCIWFDCTNKLQSSDFYPVALHIIDYRQNIIMDSQTESIYFDPLIKAMVDALNVFKVEHPESSPEEMSYFAHNKLQPVFDSFPQTQLFRSDVGDLPYIRERLNSQERDLLNENLTVGLYVMNHALSAREMTTYYYGENRRNDNSDAFRHAYWNALMTNDEDVGADWAERWGNAHEDGASDNPPLEREMDLFNNRIGRSIRGNEGFELAQNVKDAVDSGEMRRIIQSNGSLVPTDSSGSIR